MLGQKYGYYDASNWKCAAKVDLFLDAWVDMLEKAAANTMKMASGGDAAEVGAEMDKVIENIYRPALKAMEAQLSADGGPYLAGAKLTIADCCMVALMANVMENPAGPWSQKLATVTPDYPKV